MIIVFQMYEYSEFKLIITYKQAPSKRIDVTIAIDYWQTAHITKGLLFTVFFNLLR